MDKMIITSLLMKQPLQILEIEEISTPQEALRMMELLS
jgi:hypothetical protein